MVAYVRALIAVHLANLNLRPLMYRILVKDFFINLFHNVLIALKFFFLLIEGIEEVNEPDMAIFHLKFVWLRCLFQSKVVQGGNISLELISRHCS